MVLTLKKDIIIQSEPEKQDKNQISAKKIKTCQILKYNFLMRQILKYNFLMRQILKQIFRNVSDFDLNVFTSVRFLIEKNTMRSILN